MLLQMALFQFFFTVEQYSALCVCAYAHITTFRKMYILEKEKKTFTKIRITYWEGGTRAKRTSSKALTGTEVRVAATEKREMELPEIATTHQPADLASAWMLEDDQESGRTALTWVPEQTVIPCTDV